MEQPPLEAHPLEPFLPRGAKLLMLGSFPPPRVRWGMEFYYPNFQNDMWRVMGLAFFGDKDHFVDGKRFDRERLVAFCTEKGIALSDTAVEVRRLGGNASDNFLQIVTRRDIPALLARLPDCRAVVTTGQKATDTLLEGIPAPQPAVGSFSEAMMEGRTVRLWRMPSTSRAYPLPLAAKAEAYVRMLAFEGLL